MREKVQLLFVQGGGEGVHDEWDNKLVASLEHTLGNRFDIRYPRMPNEGDPSYELWKSVLEQELVALKDGTVLVGHSVGGTILMRLLAEPVPAPKLGGIFLISAPFLGQGGWLLDGVDFSQNLGTKLPTGIPVHFYHGLEDGIVPPTHAELYARAVPQSRMHHLPGCDHQLNNDLSGVASVIAAL